MTTSSPTAPAPKSAANAHPSLSQRLRELRQARGWTLKELSDRTGISVSSLSKVENKQISMTYDNLVRLAHGLEIELGDLFSTGLHDLPSGRRAITRAGEGAPYQTQAYDYELLCTEMTPKRMVPMITKLKARGIDEFGPPLRHSGEEFIYVLAGEVVVFLEGYRETRLVEGDCIYIDSRLGHAYFAAGDNEAVILGICSDGLPEPGEPLS